MQSCVLPYELHYSEKALKKMRSFTAFVFALERSLFSNILWGHSQTALTARREIGRDI